MLVVMSGHGWVQAEGGPVYDMLPGDVVVIAPNVRHWHGATSTSSMSHVAIAAADDKRQSVYWLEYVTDTQYHGPQR
ncbi:cupin domain-containing protein [Acetobacter sp. UBA5411]|uniref:cupin domain-containing protein n=1 Tax=Acetobacter sp. UBA5411 TaxID=1945905 RepID=UPI0025C068C2|nr:cupin domain-containing protein [Acetobacter sp. UBA5411]